MEIPEQAIVEALHGCSSSSVFDALEEIGIDHGGVLGSLRCFGKRTRAAGPVETLQAEVRLQRSYPVDAFSIGQQIRLSPPGSVLVIDLQGERVSGWGGLATRSAVRGDLAACVIRGGARDVEEIDTLDFLLAVEHVTPRTGKGRIRFTARGVPIQWNGVRIDPGDWMVIDRTGVVVIPGNKVVAVAKRAGALEAADAQFARMLDQGVDFEGASRRLGHF